MDSKKQETNNENEISNDLSKLSINTDKQSKG